MSDPRSDAFADWLDATTAGRSTPASGAIDADLDALQDAAARFHGLDTAASRHALATRFAHRSWEDTMQSASHARTGPYPSVPPTRPSTRNARPVMAAQAWASYALVALVVAGLTLGLARATGLFGARLPSEPTIIPFAALQSGIPGEAASPISAADCTIDPPTRASIVAHLEASNVATETPIERYSQPVTPSDQDVESIQHTYRLRLACGGDDQPLAYVYGMETPWFTSQTSLVFEGSRELNESGTRVSTTELETLVDLSMMQNPGSVFYPASTEPEPNSAATPAFSDTPGYIPTLFPDFIEIVGPDYAVATLLCIEPTSGRVLPGAVIRIGFAKIDGIWKIDSYQSNGQG